MDFKILDASAFYAGIPFASSETWYTTPLVYDEIKHIKKNQNVIQTMIETKRLDIIEPKQESIKQAVTISKKTGDFNQLSKADLSILALCAELSGQIVTDDFAISNAAKHFHIKIIPIMTSGIKDQGTWIHYCPGCRKNFKNHKTCPLCATELKRKLIKR